MREFPKIFCTKQDYLNMISDKELSAQAKKTLLNLAEDRFVWADSGEVFTPIKIPVEATPEEIKIIEQKNKSHRSELDNENTSRLINTAKEGEADKWAIFEKIEDKNAEVFRLGFTLSEIAKLTA